jgi:carbonic anhydrase/acetyltransferase-like protein (isoleucine patch superfamily)
MLISRNGIKPKVDATSFVAPSAQVIGNVAIGEQCYIDYNVVIESSGASILIGNQAIILANTVVRSTGGDARKLHPVTIGERTLISPQCALAGCAVGSNCYVATAVLIFQGAKIGDNSRISAGAIIHVNTEIPRECHVGLRHIRRFAREMSSASSDDRRRACM